MRAFALFLVVASLWPATIVAKDYSTPRVVIDATILADGTVRYVEHRSYAFEGSFSEADYVLSRTGFDEVRNLSVCEGKTPFLRSSGEAPGTYQIDERRDDVKLSWFYRAEDESRTFTVAYDLLGAVPKGESHAEFFWTFLSDRWERGTDSLIINVNFASAHSIEDVRVFLRGAEDRATVAVHADGVQIIGTGFGRNDALRARIVFPASMVAGAPVNAPGLSLARVEDEEMAYHAEKIARAERRERLAGRWSMIAVLVAGVSVLTFLVIYGRYGRRPELPIRPPSEVYAPPSGLPPAIASALASGAWIGAHSLIATLFDLCRRGHFKLVELEPEQRFLQKDRIDYRIERSLSRRDDEVLLPWEREVVELVDQSISEGKDTVREVFDLSKGKRQTWFTKWQAAVQEDVRARGWHRPENKRAQIWNLASQVPLLGLSIASLVFAGPIGSLPLAMTAVMLVMTAALNPRTQEGELQYELWRAYRQALRRADADQLRDGMDTNFVYAVAFMIGARRLEHLVNDADTSDFFWLTSISGSPLSPVHLTSTITSMTSTVGSSISAGTGASVGVAGGGAGGGAR